MRHTLSHEHENNLFPGTNAHLTVMDHGTIMRHDGQQISDDVSSFITEQKKYILTRNFSCPGGKASWGETGTIYVGAYTGNILHDEKVLCSLLHDVQTFATTEHIHQTLQQKEMPRKAFHAIFPETQFADGYEGQLFFAQLLKQLNAYDENYYPVASGYSRTPTDANYMISIGWIAYFANVGYKFQKKYDRFSSIPNILLAPQDSFEWLKKKWAYDKMAHEVRDVLTITHGAYHPGLSSLTSGTPAIGNFLLTENDDKTIAAVSKIMGFSPKRYKKNLASALIEKGCPYHQAKDKIKEIWEILTAHHE